MCSECYNKQIKWADPIYPRRYTIHSVEKREFYSNIKTLSKKLYNV